MKIFKHPEENIYYTQDKYTLQWYADLQWRYKRVQKSEGPLLAEGTLAEIKKELPPDLFEAISRYFQIREKKRLILP